MLKTLKEQPQLYDLHTHLLGMGNAGFWVDSILMNSNIMPTNSTFHENESVRSNFCPLIWCENNHKALFGFVDGNEAAEFLYHLIEKSGLPKKTRKEFNKVTNKIQRQFWFLKLAQNKELIKDFKLNQELLHRGLCFKNDFSYDVVLKLGDLHKGFGTKDRKNHDLTQIAVAEKLGIYSSRPLVKFRDWIIFNAREQKFEIVYGIRVEDLRQLIYIDPNATNEAQRLARAHIINAFSMCDAEGTPARHVDLQGFHGNFTPQFYPRRFALKDSIYHQRLDVLAALIIHIIERYQSCLPPVKYCEFSVSVNDLSRAWMFDVLRSFSFRKGFALGDQLDNIVQAEMDYSSFSQIVCNKHFYYLRVVYEPDKNEPNKLHFKYEVDYKFLAGFSREKVKSKHFKDKDQDEALRLLTDSPQDAMLLMAYEITDSSKLKNEQLATRETFAPFVDDLSKLKKDIKKKPSFYKWLVGLDLFADELGYPYCPFVACPFIKYVQRRRKYNKRFGLRIHGGENVIFADNDSAAYRLFIAHMYIVFISLQFLQRKLEYGIRIGHGIAFERIFARSMSRSRHRKSAVLLAVMEYMAPSLFKNIAFEINITSNEYLLGHTLRQADFAHTHRLNALFDANIHVILATDDDGIWPIDHCSCVHPGHQSLAAEYCRAISSSLISEEGQLESILESAKNFNFWDPELDRDDLAPDDSRGGSRNFRRGLRLRKIKPKGGAAALPLNDDDDDDKNDKPDPDNNMINPIIVHPSIIKRIDERYADPNVTSNEFRTRWKQLSESEPEVLKGPNEAMERVAFICVCGNSKDDTDKKSIRTEYEQLFGSCRHFDFIYENWKKIRDEFMSFDGYNNSSIASHRVIIEKSSCRPSTKRREVEVKIHAFGPNMINNENVKELEYFKEFYKNYTNKISLFIYTNNDKNKYHYQETSESLVIEVNPNPSKRETQRENFLYALCEHASAATAALHCITDHVAHCMDRSKHNTNDYDDNVLHVFDSDMTSPTLRYDGSHKESTINSKLMDLLHGILKDLFAPRKSNSKRRRRTENELIQALLDYKRVRFLFHK